MLMLLFGFIGLMLDLTLALIYGIIKLALYISPIILLIYFIKHYEKE